MTGFPKIVKIKDTDIDVSTLYVVNSHTEMGRLGIMLLREEISEGRFSYVRELETLKEKLEAVKKKLAAGHELSDETFASLPEVARVAITEERRTLENERRRLEVELRYLIEDSKLLVKYNEGDVDELSRELFTNKKYVESQAWRDYVDLMEGTEFRISVQEPTPLP